MPSSFFGKIKLRLLDRFLSLAEPPNRIDLVCRVSPLARITSSRLHGPVRVGDHATIHRAELSGPVAVGKNSSLWGPEIYVYARGDSITIGNFCSIARNVSIHGFYHDPRRISTYYVGRNILGRDIEDEVVSRGPTRIGHDVWIGAGVHIMSGVEIGNGAVIGAGSVVSRDVPRYAIAVGSPATPIRLRFEQAIIERLEASEWWEWSHEKIREHEELFIRHVTPELLDGHL